MERSSSNGKDDLNWNEPMEIWSQVIAFASQMVHYGSKNMQSLGKGSPCPFFLLFQKVPGRVEISPQGLPHETQGAALLCWMLKVNVKEEKSRTQDPTEYKS